MKVKVQNVRLVILLVAILIVQAHYALAKSIGVIMTGDIPYYQDIHTEFLDGISGFLSQHGIEIVIQKPMPDPMSWTNAARKLVTIGSSVIISYGAPATLTTMKETSDIPIVFAGVYDPEAMRMTGKNATGISSTVPIETLLKHLSGISKLSKLGIIFSKYEKDTIIQIRDLKKSEGSFGFKSVFLNLSKKVNKEEIKDVDTLLLTTCSIGMIKIKDIIQIARRDKIPTAALMGGGENEGVVLTITADIKEQGTELAAMVKKVLGGAKPSEISLKQPKQVGIIINLKEAKNLGLNIPADILSSVSKVIE